jgi:hypothetical protein
VPAGPPAPAVLDRNAKKGSHPATAPLLLGDSRRRLLCSASEPHASRSRRVVPFRTWKSHAPGAAVSWIAESVSRRAPILGAVAGTYRSTSLRRTRLSYCSARNSAASTWIGPRR